MNETEQELSAAVADTMSKIDFGDLKNASVFGGDNFVDMIGQILSGKFFETYPDILSGVSALLGGIVFAVLPAVVLIVAITILCGFAGTVKSADSGVASVIYFVAYSAVVLTVSASVVDLISMAGDTLTAIKTQIDAVFPIILTLMAAGGGTASAGIYQSGAAVLSFGVMQIFSAVAMPLFIITFAFSVVSNIAPNTKLDKFVGFFSSLFKWIVGICFTVFLAFMAIQGITAGSFDSVSIRATKMTIGSYVPIVGGYISQGFDLVMASTVLIKNAVGLSGIFLLFGIVLAPVLKIIVFSLAIKLASAVSQPIADSRISDFLTSVTKSFSMLTACLLGGAFMYFVTLALFITTGNYI
jgi:stage III sporulation protein AE